MPPFAYALWALVLVSAALWNHTLPGFFQLAAINGVFVHESVKTNRLAALVVRNVTLSAVALAVLCWR